MRGRTTNGVPGVRAQSDFGEIGRQAMGEIGVLPPDGKAREEFRLRGRPWEFD